MWIVKGLVFTVPVTLVSIMWLKSAPALPWRYSLTWWGRMEIEEKWEQTISNLDLKEGNVSVLCGTAGLRVTQKKENAILLSVIHSSSFHFNILPSLSVYSAYPTRGSSTYMALSHLHSGKPELVRVLLWHSEVFILQFPTSLSILLSTPRHQDLQKWNCSPVTNASLGLQTSYVK